MGFGVFIHRSDPIYDDSPAEQYQFPSQYFGRVRLDRICPEAVELFKDKHVPINTPRSEARSAATRAWSFEGSASDLGTLRDVWVSHGNAARSDAKRKTLSPVGPSREDSNGHP